VADGAGLFESLIQSQGAVRGVPEKSPLVLSPGVLVGVLIVHSFLDVEAKRPAQGYGIRPIERVPFKITKPTKGPSSCSTLGFVRSAGKRVPAIPLPDR
jgi:hypothetical protein